MLQAASRPLLRLVQDAPWLLLLVQAAEALLRWVQAAPRLLLRWVQAVFRALLLRLVQAGPLAQLHGSSRSRQAKMRPFRAET